MNPKIVVTVSIAAFITLFIIIISGLTYYTSSSGDYVMNDQQSQDKLAVIDEAFRSVLGPKWPYIILIFIIFVAIILYFLYIASINNAISITMSDIAANRFNMIFMWFTIIFSIFMVILVVKQYLDYRKQQQTGNVPNYVPTQDQQQRNTKIIIILGLLLFIISFIVWYMKKS